MCRYFGKKKVHTLYFSLAILLCFFSIKCLGQMASPLPFSEFTIINKENYDAIRTAKLLVNYTQSRSDTPEALQKEIDREIASLNELQKNAVNEQQKQQIELIKTEMPETRRRQANQTHTAKRKYIVDINSNQFRLDQIPEKKETATSSGLELSTTVLSDAKLINYLKNEDHAIVDYNQKRGIKKTPCQLGTIDPDIFDYNTFESRIETVNLDGHEVVKYEITFDHWKNKTLIYADPSLGYRYRKLESYRDDLLIQTVEAKDYKLFGGIYFPTVHKKVKYKKDQSTQTEIMKILDAKFNIEISPDVFRIKYTRNTTIHDLQLGEIFSPFVSEEIIDLELQNIDVIDVVTDLKLKNTSQHDEASKKD